MEQSLFSELTLAALSYLTAGNYFLIPGTNEYYALNDSSIYKWKRDDRLLFIEDMKKSKDIFMFILTNSRFYTNEKDGLYWRRVPVWESKKEEWKQIKEKHENNK